MMNKLFTIMVAFMLLSALPALADGGQMLTINGEKVEKAVVKMTFKGDYVVLHFADESSQTADMNAVALKLDVSGTGIFSLKSVLGDKMHIDGLSPETEISVYDASGRMVLAAKADKACATLSVKSLKSGVYVMKAGKQVVKFIKR
jgi:hypothetical protein